MGASPLKLAEWRKQNGMSQVDLAEAIGCTQPYVSQIERAQRPVMPSPPVMERIFVVTEGAVEPNDFYDLPRWRRMLSAAVAKITGKAAA